jgi:uncharacterized protein YlxW (UPF0749 family)
MTDIAVALGLIAVAVVFFLLARMEVLPRKSLPYVAAALVSALTFGLVNAWRKRENDKDYEKKKAELEKLRKDARDLAAAYKDAKAETERIQAEADRAEETHRIAIMQSEARTAEEKARIGGLHGDDARREFMKRFGGAQ